MRENSGLVVISPHLDDAVFSCGDLLASNRKSTVVSVCTGGPHAPAVLTPWDEQCGFASAQSALCTRLQENRYALELLGCSGIELGLPDDQYVDDWEPYTPELRASLVCALRDLHPTQVVIPLGLFHADHIRVSDMLLSLIGQFPCSVWMAYEDVPYRARPDAVSKRLSLIRQHGFEAHRAASPWRSDRKSRAVFAYGSQLKGFGSFPNDLSRPEGYWRLTPAQERS